MVDVLIKELTSVSPIRRQKHDKTPPASLTLTKPPGSNLLNGRFCQESCSLSGQINSLSMLIENMCVDIERWGEEECIN